ncbi:hypothetical protein B7486_09340 [cyanobacterium TDX16]|nr:hypothetical protein B7486_09340 [cyanobacterium TDX16]
MSIIEPITEPSQNQPRFPLIVRVPKPSFDDQFPEFLGFAILNGLLVLLANNLPRIMSVFAPLPPPIRALLMMVPLMLVAMLFLRKSGGPAIARIQKAARKSRGKETHAFIADVAKALPTFIYDKRVYTKLAFTLRDEGHTGDTVILFTDFSPMIVDNPLRDVIGPVSLDEADPVFQSIATGSHDSTNPDLERSSSEAGESRPHQPKRWIYPGGVGYLGSITVLLGVLLAISIWFFGQPLISSIIVAAFLVLLFLIPLFRHELTSCTWYLVSGGLVMREPGTKKRDTKVHLFRPNDSILVFKELGPQAWLMIVHDDTNSGLTRVSEAERCLLLRAWLSPIPPPTVEKFVDLT